MPNPLAKRRPPESPYAVFLSSINPSNVFAVLKTYKMAKNEDIAFDRWLINANTSHTHGTWEMGDSYIQPILKGLLLVSACPEFKAAYPSATVMYGVKHADDPAQYLRYRGFFS